MDPAHEVKRLVVVDEAGRAVRLAHDRPHARPLRGGYGGFLDDLFVHPAMRGKRIADALIEAIAAIGRAKAWGRIRWVTADDNDRSREVYARLATRSTRITYKKMLELMG
jgi:GNAT superfamily N-acetyltransferase